MASLTPAAVQNENLHILKGKSVAGAKSGIIQEENLHVLKGEVIEGFHAEIPKPAKAGRQGRKALTDVSRSRKPVLPAANKATALEDKYIAAIQETYKLTDEQMAQCMEWAKEGIEHMPFTYNDMRKLEDQQKEERLEREYPKAMGGLQKWTDMAFGLEIPVEEDLSDTEDTLLLELEPEVLPSTPRARTSRWPKTSGYGVFDELFDPYVCSVEFDQQLGCFKPTLIKRKEE